MCKVKLAMYDSLDSVVESPAWTGRFWNDELSQFQKAYLFASDALLLGRVTHQGLAATWPATEGTGEFAEKMNTMPRFVCSNSLETASGTPRCSREIPPQGPPN